MLITPEDAREKRCPGENCGELKWSAGGEEGRVFVPHCIADGCMAWRWEAPRADGAPPRGYCGIAGYPFGVLAGLLVGVQMYQQDQALMNHALLYPVGEGA